MPYIEKINVAKFIGGINWQFRDKEKHMMLMSPGRIGTSSHELGVPTAFSDISGFDVICEMEEVNAGYNPEFSYGSHIFQDLVEAEILYTAVLNNNKTLKFSPEMLERFEDVSESFDGGKELKGIVRVYKADGCTLYYDINEEHLMVSSEDPI